MTEQLRDLRNMMATLPVVVSNVVTPETMVEVRVGAFTIKAMRIWNWLMKKTYDQLDITVDGNGDLAEVRPAILEVFGQEASYHQKDGRHLFTWVREPEMVAQTIIHRTLGPRFMEIAQEHGLGPEQIDAINRCIAITHSIQGGAVDPTAADNLARAVARRPLLEVPGKALMFQALRNMTKLVRNELDYDPWWEWF
jgi:hypothetical protein